MSKKPDLKTPHKLRKKRAKLREDLAEKERKLVEVFTEIFEDYVKSLGQNDTKGDRT